MAAAARLGLEPPVPACPGWTVADLVRHTGTVQRHKATIVRERLRRPPRAADFPAAPSPDLLIDWFEEGAAHGAIAPVPAPLARDGVDEVLDVMLARLRDVHAGTGDSVHLHCTDADGEWLLTLEPDRVRVRLGHAKGDCAARGGASDLLLFLWGRLPWERLVVFGNAELLARVRQLAAQATQ